MNQVLDALAAAAEPARLDHRLGRSHLGRLTIHNRRARVRRHRLTMSFTGRVDHAAAAPFGSSTRRRGGRFPGEIELTRRAEA